MVISYIKSAQQILQQEITFGHPKRHLKKIRIVCYTLVQNGRGKVNRSRPTYFDIDIYLHYV